MRNQSTRQFVISTLMWLLMLSVCGSVSANDAILQCDYQPTVNQPKESVSDWNRNPSKYISPYQLQHKLSKKNHRLFLADIRNADAYKLSHIDQSFSLPHSKLIAMQFLKDRELVMVGQGRSYRHLESLHQDLLAKGFKDVKILDGGVDYWKTVIEGKSLISRMDDYYLIDDAMGGDTDFWQIIDTSSNPNLDQHFDDVIALKDTALLSDPRSFVKNSKQASHLIKNVLLILPENIDTLAVLKAWRKQLKTNVYAMGPAKVQAALKVLEHNRRIVQYKKRRTDGAKMSCS